MAATNEDKSKRTILLSSDDTHKLQHLHSNWIVSIEKLKNDVFVVELHEWITLSQIFDAGRQCEKFKGYATES